MPESFNRGSASSIGGFSISLNNNLLKMPSTKYQVILSTLALAIVTNGVVSAYSDGCEYEIVESMPDLLQFNKSISFKPTPTHKSLLNMIDNAKTSIRVASFYWTLSAEQEFASHPSAQPGKEIMEAIVSAVVDRGVNLEVVLDNSNRKEMSNPEDVKKLKSLGKVYFLNMRDVLKAGVLHTKFLIADNETFYVGSSNFDWRSYSQIKEMGITFKKCNVLAEDLDKIFNTYTLISSLGHIPETLPEYLKTSINSDSPVNLKLDKLEAKVFLAGSPPAFNGVKEWLGRTDDIDGLLQTINKARKQVDISVMNYSPRVEFAFPKKYWPRIDNALRRAASERNVRVRLLFSDWSQTKPEEVMWYKSLNALQSKAMKGSIHVRLFKVPAFDDFQKKIPYARVKHDKYMVTDNGLYIGTSNWSADYFINTCGVSVVIEPKVENDSIEGSVIQNMQDLFDRDFTSEHSREL